MIIIIRQCIICKKVIGEVGDNEDKSITGTICDSCMLTLEQHWYYRDMYEKTGFITYKHLAEDSMRELAKKEVNGLNLKYQTR